MTLLASLPVGVYLPPASLPFALAASRRLSTTLGGALQYKHLRVEFTRGDGAVKRRELQRQNAAKNEVKLEVAWLCEGAASVENSCPVALSISASDGVCRMCGL